MAATTEHQKLEQLIDRLLQPGADTAAIEQRIWERFGARACIVFSDMTGFSKRSARSGIVDFLTHMMTMRKLIAPIIAKHGGTTVKYIADSQLMLFDSASEGFEACLEIQAAIFAYNARRREAERIYLGCGVGYGDVLKLDDDEVYGVEVNFAAKLGEDLAGPYEILVTSAVSEAVGEHPTASFKRVRGGRLGGTRQGYFKADYEMPGSDAVLRRALRQRVRFK